MGAKEIIGYLPEDASPYVNLSVRENLEYLASLRGLSDIRERADDLMDTLDLREYEKYKVNKLSRGNRQKLSIGLSIIHKPKVVLLDEPLNYLDIPTQEAVTSLFNSLDATILCSTHIMSIAEKLTENILIIAKGNVVWSGSMNDLRSLGTEEESVEHIVSKLMVNVR
ncbi:MAG TPA: ABC transporter ATP-binding protein, partial [Thermoplasmataceae archaeon]|nr:ABC transporter ATP-binding protein [Thermoplasmataceae archaeon]